MIVGFTGTRNGMTEAQRTTIRRALALWRDNGLKPAGLHGDCVGADVDFHVICRELELRVWKMPSNWASTTADTDAESFPGYEEPKRPYARNRDIAGSSDRMLACPPNFEFIERSGTWYTATYAARKGKRVTIVFPNGMTDVRNREA